MISWEISFSVRDVFERILHPGIGSVFMKLSWSSARRIAVVLLTESFVSSLFIRFVSFCTPSVSSFSLAERRAPSFPSSKRDFFIFWEMSWITKPRLIVETARFRLG